MNCHRFTQTFSRRALLRASAGGFGHLVLSALAARQGVSALGQTTWGSQTLAHPPHFAPRAKRLLFLFMWGGPSHVDLFDPKPRLNASSGKSLAGKDVGEKRDQLGSILGSPFKFAQHGQSGIWMSELFPHLARHADKLCVVRSLHTEGTAHGEALLRLHTGNANLVRPSVGAWVSYGLGSENENLPAFITISPPRGHGGVQNYGNAFLPAIHQGTAIGSAETPIAKAVIPNLKNTRIDPGLQRQQLDLVQALNRKHLQDAGSDPGIEGLIGSYELAYRMQSTVPQILSLDDESQATRDLYVQASTDYTWDHHNKVEKGHIEEAAKVDRPIAGLLQDLDQRGLLHDTLVLWGGEFGRTPTVENGDGRGHHPQVFTMWMAGGGVRHGLTYGTTDDFGFHPVSNPVHMHDLHATLLHILGLNHEKLTFRHAGRDFRLTDVYGRVVHDILG